ncbi:MAG TPA: hypothetical protein ENJ06_02125 [Phycisphaeraceae bacterium]|nr:hypothetical protein [Phycisphaeraceae bacterium]
MLRIAGLLLPVVSLSLLTGCETRVISAKGIGSERYKTQPSFEEEYGSILPPKKEEYKLPNGPQ